MTRHDFDVMLSFKAGAGIVPLAQWVRQLAEEYIFNDDLQPHGGAGRNSETAEATGANPSAQGVTR